MQIQANKRINYNVPQRLVNQIRVVAAQQGMEPYYWIHKVLERAIREAGSPYQKEFGGQLDLSRLEAFNNE